MLVPLSYTATKGSLSSRSQSSGKANPQRETSRLRIVYIPLNALTSVKAVVLPSLFTTFETNLFTQFEKVLFHTKGEKRAFSKVSPFGVEEDLFLGPLA